MTYPERPGMADTLEIRGGWPPYVLRLRLLESEALDNDVEPAPAAMLPGAEPSDPGSGNEKGNGIP
jgi:hypothetical protein